MMRQVRIAMISVALAALGTSAAFATPDVTGKSKQRDPNEVVCEKQKELGSRVAVKRVCLTRAEWAERRRLDRMDIEKAQTSKRVQGE
jgi:hypothetical protein